MWLVNRLKDEAARVIFRNNAIYTFSERRALQASTTLPDETQALSILETASPRPKDEYKANVRNWPDNPVIDMSIIIPCYNAEKFVEQCVRSVTSQNTNCSIEILCIDDGSTDKTGMILDHMARNDPRIRIIHQSNKGFGGARNTGIAEANGRTLMFLDSDDMLLPGAIETLYEAYTKSDCDYVTASYIKLSENGHKTTPIHGKRNHGAPWGRLYSREIWRNLQFPENFWFEDTVQGFCIESHWTERYIDIPVYLYRRNRKGISVSSHKSKKGLDTLWIVPELIEWHDQLGYARDQKLYDVVIGHMGRLLLSRTAPLTDQERKAMFVYASAIVQSLNPNNLLIGSREGRWQDVEKALLTRNYQLWITAVRGCN